MAWSQRVQSLLKAACAAALLLTAFLLCTGGKGIVIEDVISMRSPRYPAIYFGLLALAFGVLRREWIKAPTFWLVAAYVGWAVLGDLFRGQSIGDRLEYTLTNVGVLALFYAGMANQVRSRRLVRGILLVYISAGCAIAFFSTYEHWTQGLDTLCPHLAFWPTKGRLGSFALALAATGFGLASGYRRTLGLLCLFGCVGIVGAVTLLFTYDRTSYVGLVAGLAVLFMVSWRRGWILILVLAGLMAVTAAIGMRGYRSNQPFHTSIPGRIRSLFDSKDKNTWSRLLVFRGACRVALERPWVGVSEAGFKPVYDRVKDPREKDSERRDEFHAHNIVLQSAATRGIPAGLLLIAWMAATLRWLLPGIRAHEDPLKAGVCLVAVTAFASFFASGMGDVPKFENELTLALQLGLAAAVRQVRPV